MTEEVLRSIPHRPPFLFVDKVVEKREDGIVCSRLWRAEEKFYKGHYPNAPLTPGVLLCESVFQTAAIYLVQANASPLSREAGPLPRESQSDSQGTDEVPLQGDADKRIPVLCRIENAKFKGMVFPGDEVLIDVTEEERLAGFCQLRGVCRCKGKVVLQIKFTLAMVEKSES